MAHSYDWLSLFNYACLVKTSVNGKIYMWLDIHFLDQKQCSGWEGKNHTGKWIPKFQNILLGISVSFLRGWGWHLVWSTSLPHIDFFPAYPFSLTSSDCGKGPSVPMVGLKSLQFSFSWKNWAVRPRTSSYSEGLWSRTIVVNFFGFLTSPPAPIDFLTTA